MTGPRTARLRSALAAALVLAAAGAAAQERIDIRGLTCAAVQALVARRGTAILASSDLVYETVHRESGDCRIDETSLPAFEPTADARACFAGWRCTQRSNDPGQK